MPRRILLNDKGTVFHPPAASNSAYFCTFQRKFEDANAGLSGAYKSFWTKVPDVSDTLYKKTPPETQEKWFSELMNFTIDPAISEQYKTIQDKYHPERIYAVHPALNPIWYEGGRKGLRDPHYRPVIDIDTLLTPLVVILPKKDVTSRPVTSGYANCVASATTEPMLDVASMPLGVAV